MLARLPRRSIAALLAAVVVAGACSGSDEPDVAPTTTLPPPTTVPTRPDDGVLSIGAFLPTTGPGASLGGPMIEAVQSAVRLINEAGGVFGQDVELHVEDESDETSIESLLAEGVDAIVGPASSLVALSELGATVHPSTGVVTCSPSATALSLDDFPDNNFFFRTVPSDSLQMAAIGRRVTATGRSSVAVGYLDDLYGRGLARALRADLLGRPTLELVAEVSFGGDQENLTEPAAELLENDPGVVVVLGDADDGSRLLTALDQATRGGVLPRIIVNDAIRTARQTVQNLSPEFREQIEGVSPLARSVGDTGPSGFFTAHAFDCVNLIALAAVEAGSDAPTKFRAHIPAVSVGGQSCTSFQDCAALIAQDLRIDYNGPSGTVELSNSTGDPTRARFELFRFNADGVDEPVPGTSTFEAP